MNSELFSLNLQDLETLISKSNCACHFINPNKTRIILWKEEKDGQVIYYLRIGIQKFISYPLTDKNGATYWKFKPCEKAETSSNTTPTNPTDLDPITKFRQRQAKTEALNHGKSDNAEQSVHSSTS
jgi:hypothetical protein